MPFSNSQTSRRSMEPSSTQTSSLSIEDRAVKSTVTKDPNSTGVPLKSATRALRRSWTPQSRARPTSKSSYLAERITPLPHLPLRKMKLHSSNWLRKLVHSQEPGLAKTTSLSWRQTNRHHKSWNSLINRSATIIMARTASRASNLS